MLVRINAAAAGVANYLETGRKRGREFERDLIDQRMVLGGDLALVDALIDSIETAQEGDARYLHITLGFSESFTTAEVCGADEINFEKLKQITDAYRDLLMCAYDRREYAWYAEAHIPKVTHELHESSGEYITRLPHVHIVLPMRNLEDGRYLNPTGHGKTMVDAGYAQAIQERVNAQFGLRSPAEFRRDQPHNALAKHNPQFRAATPKQVRETAARLVVSGQASSFDELARRLSELGDVRVRIGAKGTYLNVKPSWAAKGINLKEFMRETFDLAAAKLRAETMADASGFDFETSAAVWQEVGAFEARYLTSANRKHYKKLDASGKRAWLEQKVMATRARLDAHERLWEPGADGPNAEFLNSLEIARGRSTPLKPGFDRARTAWRAAALYQSGLGQASPGQSSKPLAGVRDLSSVGMVHEQRTLAMLLHADAPDRLERRRQARDEMRRSGAGAPHVGGIGRNPLTFAGTLIAARERAGPDPEQLKSDTSPSIVLEAASRIFKINPAHYSIGCGRDGGPRILHADKQYNLGDFFTKHLNVPWGVARPILEDCYHATLSDGLPPPDRDLWRSFSAWRHQFFEARRAEAEEARAAVRARLVQAREQYKRVKINIRSTPSAKRHAELAQARAQKILAEDEARRMAQELRKRPSRNALYREFLAELANRGNLVALAELRRAAPLQGTPFEGLTGSKSKPVLPLPEYEIDPHGQVTYFKHGRSMVIDSARGIAVLRSEAVAYETALQVAVARYGRSLTLHGDKAFFDSIVAAARRSGVEVTIRDASAPFASPVVLRSPERRAR